MLFEDVLKVGTTFVGVGNLLLKNSVLLGIDVIDSILGVRLQIGFELFILRLLPLL